MQDGFLRASHILPDPEYINDVKQMNVADLHKALAEDPALLLIDVRTEEEFLYEGRVEEATLIELNRLWPGLQSMDRNQPIALICRSGNRSQFAGEFLVEAGFSNVANVVGGMLAWAYADYDIA